MNFQKSAVLAMAMACSAIGAQAATLETTDFIATPTQFNGFEAIGISYNYPATYTEDGITVSQINSLVAPIWTTYTPNIGGQGLYGWYPNGGDFGYTSITLQSGADFQNISFLVGSGFGNASNLGMYYELRLNGGLVQSGSLDQTGQMHWLGFSGGGFDEVLLGDSSFRPVTSFGSYNALALDSIKVSASAVPEPGSYALVLAGLATVGALARRRTR
jgi:hypothetical protein